MTPTGQPDNPCTLLYCCYGKLPAGHGQHDKEGSDKNVGNPDTTLDDILTDATWRRAIALRDLGQSPEYEAEVRALKAEAKAAIDAYTAKAVREELEQLKTKAGKHWHQGWTEDMFIRTDAIDTRIEQLKQEGGDK